jgi:hypothetical protein
MVGFLLIAFVELDFDAVGEQSMISAVVLNQ